MRTPLLTTLAALWLAGGAAAQTSYPMVTHVTPLAVQRANDFSAGEADEAAPA